ncbi:MAG TPA: hypothetical protein DD738_06150 [Ruminiclostridium sp.]|nr:hypothetical protein [Ruminiclostridium sp.]
MFKRIIVITGLSADSDAFTSSLRNLRTLGSGECLLLRCLTGQETTDISFSYFTSVVEKNLQKQKEQLEELGFKTESRILLGATANEINEIALGEDYSLIVAGAKKQSLTIEVLFGSTAHSVIRSAKKPVLLLRPSANSKEPADPENAGEPYFNSHVLFPTDFSDNAAKALDYVLEMAAAGVRKVTLLHIQDKARISPQPDGRLREFNSIDSDRLFDIKKRIQEKAAIPVDILIKYGSPSAEILKSAKELNATLVIMGTRGRGFVKELLMGSVSNHVAHLADSSVLLIPLKS